MSSSLISHLSRNWHLPGIGESIEVCPCSNAHGRALVSRNSGQHLSKSQSYSRCKSPIRSPYLEAITSTNLLSIKWKAQHRQTQADLTVAAFPVPIEDASQIWCDSGRCAESNYRLPRKATKSGPNAVRSQQSACKHGQYFFKAAVLEEALITDAADPNSKHDFGHNIIPRLVQSGADVRIL